MKIQKILFLVLFGLVVTAANPSHADESYEIAAFLWFDRCFPKQNNTCFLFNGQFPNITVSLSKKEENAGYTIYEGSSTREQDFFGHHYTQKVTIQKTVTKLDGKPHFTIIATAIDENAEEVVHPISVSTSDIETLNTVRVNGVRIEQPQLESVVIPWFYVGKKFIQQ